MDEHDMRQVLKRAVETEPDLMSSFIQGPIQYENSSSEIAWCLCGGCRVFEDPRMNLCCCQSPCITTKPEFRNLCLRHDVVEIANILNWSFQTNLEPSFASSTFRNQAYRNFVLWQHGPLGAGRRVVVPSCVTVAVRRRFPQLDGAYRGYHSAYSDSE
ncbi:P2X purinoceptor 7-like [Saccostrea cucullata]|uniref:P2X purinoceptor 7-like n=1 Tax=Saccostrea cuccullata TaxID=36930 RepID=UPI002ED103C8